MSFSWFRVGLLFWDRSWFLLFWLRRWLRFGLLCLRCGFGFLFHRLWRFFRLCGFSISFGFFRCYNLVDACIFKNSSGDFQLGFSDLSSL